MSPTWHLKRLPHFDCCGDDGLELFIFILLFISGLWIEQKVICVLGKHPNTELYTLSNSTILVKMFSFPDSLKDLQNIYNC